MHIDLSALDPDKPLEYVETDGIRGMVELFTTLDPSRTWTPRTIAEFLGVGGGGPVIAGSPATVAGELERWAEESGLDGFNIADPVPPVTFRDFVDLAVPEQQRRRLVRISYDGPTLRENFLRSRADPGPRRPSRGGLPLQGRGAPSEATLSCRRRSHRPRIRGSGPGE